MEAPAQQEVSDALTGWYSQKDCILGNLYIPERQSTSCGTQLKGKTPELKPDECDINIEELGAKKHKIILYYSL